MGSCVTARVVIAWQEMRDWEAGVLCICTMAFSMWLQWSADNAGLAQVLSRSANAYATTWVEPQIIVPQR